jgi:hypothetical protein
MSRYLRVPQFAVPQLSHFFEEVIGAMERDHNSKLNKDEANHSLLLMAPNESVWEVTVSDTGLLSTTKVAG